MANRTSNIWSLPVAVLQEKGIDPALLNMKEIQTNMKDHQTLIDSQWTSSIHIRRTRPIFVLLVCTLTLLRGHLPRFLCILLCHNRVGGGGCVLSGPYVRSEAVRVGAAAVHNGISMRVVRQYDINNDRMPCRVDILYGYSVIRPQMAVRLWG